MPRLRLDVDQETYERLVERAVAERRPIDWQAEVTLRRAVGLPFPHGGTAVESSTPTASSREPEALAR